MNASELKLALEMAATIESSIGDLYESFAAAAADPQDAQFWRLLSLEEKTHSHMMDLVGHYLRSDTFLTETDTPDALKNNLAGLRRFYDLVRSGAQSAKDMGMDPFWEVRFASDLEHSELSAVLDWLMLLPVPDDVHDVIREMTAGTTDHAERIAAFGQELQKRLPEIAFR